MGDTKNLWGGRFTGETDVGFADFNQSFGFDRRLFRADVHASVAHCHGLLAAGVLSQEETAKIESALQTIQSRAQDDPKYFDELPSEDIHSFVEARLVELIGETGRKLHTGRSRNDQVATDLRLWLRDEIDVLAGVIKSTQQAMLDLAETNSDAVLPGYTHLQRAQPVLFAHWCLAYFEMLSRDGERFAVARRRTNVLPLGSAALAGTSYSIDREAVARELGFDSITRNSLDAVSDRDFCVDFLHACSLVMVHLSRLAEDIIIYSTAEFGFFELSDAIATGSSLMPQKKNPDAMELVRGKSGRVFGHLQALLTTMKGLPLAYNKDMQEDKEAVFDAADTVAASLQVTATVLQNLSVNKERAKAAAAAGYMNATELADYLVRKGTSFREAHDTVGRLVLQAISEQVELNELPLEEMRSIAPQIDDDVYEALVLEQTLATKSAAGGTSRARVAEAFAEARARLGSGLS
ncbi:MAG: argininosuccinate lyase / amino-acid N-acetyltransferase [Blastocatellia bacterium]|jgi:argininosuccinate lyase|nr:argininosuccinate lyase / amino-acid N-acetyltransferase [Blastocatellia bacterium]